MKTSIYKLKNIKAVLTGLLIALSMNSCVTISFSCFNTNKKDIDSNIMLVKKKPSYNDDQTQAKDVTI